MARPGSPPSVAHHGRVTAEGTYSYDSGAPNVFRAQPWDITRESFGSSPAGVFEKSNLCWRYSQRNEWFPNIVENRRSYGGHVESHVAISEA